MSDPPPVIETSVGLVFGNCQWRNVIREPTRPAEHDAIAGFELHGGAGPTRSRPADKSREPYRGQGRATVLGLGGRNIDIDTAAADAHAQAYPTVTAARYDLPGPGPGEVVRKCS